jgi:hypothetical protein
LAQGQEPRQPSVIDDETVLSGAMEIEGALKAVAMKLPGNLAAALRAI